MRFVVITNNPLVNNKVDGAAYDGDASLIDILKAARDRVHLGHRLLTHPLAGSVKPGETPYKSVIISADRGEKTDCESLALIEDALAMANNMSNNARPEAWSEKSILDFQMIDYNLISDVICHMR